MEIYINGKPEETGPSNIHQLVDKKGLKADSLVVELNRQIIKQTQWHEVHLQDGDRLELLSFVGGG
ncbi:sulfur carrier protein ThiS [Desulforhopalus sp. IMCC35007]|uniref:sulfur carrier protein ThiS n=1 Tax=Desulforhopalus sp. IMCC35007 TaxID=2569543 RepID=UPI0010ADA953|nr:sulfur carrier protein ThiS [Desulforhopalus sp. IMCC35007]TKB12345.1 sulfur carrier protein ThiS [Desulforhopalus sp. IMCC35007]